jgi:Fe(3+) dicitrate transport protein
LLNAAASYAWGEVAELQLEYSYTSRQFTDDLNTVPGSADGQRGQIDGYGIWNATLNLTPAEWPVGLFVTVKNLTDELYIADRSRGILPGTPRLVQAGITYRY